MYLQYIFLLFARSQNVWIVFIGLLLITASKFDNTDKYTLKTISAKFLGDALKMVDAEPTRGYFIILSKSDDGIRFEKILVSGKLSIRYSSLDVRKISITENNKPVVYKWKGSSITLNALLAGRTNSRLVSKAEIVESNKTFTFVQGSQELTMPLNWSLQTLIRIIHQQIPSTCRVQHINQDIC